MYKGILRTELKLKLRCALEKTDIHMFLGNAGIKTLIRDIHVL